MHTAKKILALLTLMTLPLGSVAITLSWDIIAGYRIHYGETSAYTTTVDAGYANSVMLNGLTPGAAYQAALGRYTPDGVEESPLTNVFTFTADAAGQATISWLVPDGTNVYYGTSSRQYTQPIDAGNVASYTFSQPDSDCIWFFAVSYYSGTIESLYSNEVSADVCPALVGSKVVQPVVDSNPSGMAEAFQVTAAATGTASRLSVHIASTSTATKLFVGIYKDKSGHPGALLAQGSTNSVSPGQWNTVIAPPVAVTAGTKYWIALLGTGGRLDFRNQQVATGNAETSVSKKLTSLPKGWKTGQLLTDGPASVYATK